MTKKFKVWLDSGANCHSCLTQVVTLDELGISDSEWDAMLELERETTMRDCAFEKSDWGYCEL